MKKNNNKLKQIRKIIFGILKNPFTYASIVFICLMLLMIQLTYKYEAGVSMNTLGDSFWNFIIAFVAGYYDICVVTPIGRLCSFIILISGIMIFSTITGKIASIFMEAQMKKDRGLKKLKNMNGHFLLCGWRPGFEKILESVLISNPDITPDQLILVNEAESEHIEQIRAQSRFKEIKYVSGDFSDKETLERALIKTADRALVISDKTAKYSTLETDSKTVLAVLTMKNLNPRLYVAAELCDSKFESHLNMAHCDEVILTNDYENSLLATASSGMGYSNVIRELIGYDAVSGIIIEDIPPSFIGKTYKDYVKSLAPISATRSVLIGLLLNTGNFYMRRKDAVREAQKNPDVRKIVDNLKKVKTLKSNQPLLTPPSDYIIQPHAKAIFVKGRKED